MAALLDWLLDQLRALLPSRASQRTGASVAVRLILASAALFTVILSSTLLYATFYRLYVPTLLHEAPVYLQYGDSLTTASVDFVPHANYKFLSTSQPYTVHLELYVPESEANQEMANFMVTLDLCDRMNRTVHTSSRPAILPYRSWILRTLRTAVQSPLLLTGWWRESETLSVELMDAVYDRRFAPITFARLVLSKPLQVYSAKLLIRAQFTGLRYWMYYWRIPTAVFFVSLAVAWTQVFTAVAWSVMESYTGRSASQQQQEGEQEQQQRQKQLPRRSGSSRSRHSVSSVSRSRRRRRNVSATSSAAAVALSRTPSAQFSLSASGSGRDSSRASSPSPSLSAHT